MQELLNGLITQLKPADQAQILRHAKLITLKVGEVLSSDVASDSRIYFPISGSIALYVSKNNQANTVGLGVGLIGSEGAAGLQTALGFGSGNLKMKVQSSGEAYVVEGLAAQRLVQRSKSLLLIFSQYLWTVFDKIAVLASQPYTSVTSVRLANWLLLSAQRCAPAPLFLTHEQIAQLLGLRRVSVSIAANEMKKTRYISYSRGHISLLNMPALTALALG